jgi:hypothetical protein
MYSVTHCGEYEDEYDWTLLRVVSYKQIEMALMMDAVSTSEIALYFYKSTSIVSQNTVILLSNLLLRNNGIKPEDYTAQKTHDYNINPTDPSPPFISLTLYTFYSQTCDL